MSNDKEIVERTRRIETRITKIGNALGIDVGGARPVWRPDGTILLPSPGCSLTEILKAIPSMHQDDVDVFVGADYLATIVRDCENGANLT